MSDMFGDQNPHDFLTPCQSPDRTTNTSGTGTTLAYSTLQSRIDFSFTAKYNTFRFQSSSQVTPPALGLLPEQTSSIHDSPKVLISINLGHIAATLDPNDVLEVGLSVLDTRNITSTSPKQKSFPIRTHNFMITDIRGCIEISTPFAFGGCTKVSPKKFDALFQRIALVPEHKKPLYQTNGTKVVLLGKNIAASLRLMERVVPDVWKPVQIEGTVDLDVLTEQPCFFSLLEELDIRPEIGDRCLFRPGNDVNYALRVDLLYTCYTVEVGQSARAPQVEENLALISSVSLDGIPNGPVLSCSHGVKNNAITAFGEWRRTRVQKDLETQNTAVGLGSQCDGSGCFDILFRRF
ncbi:hypothetical protein DL98DRAFT_574326 [Cadophora sp. DSE1049]|nr:hypothetical protein DL98DRAFT_574326 [Cadophora sp. DSE1049]